MPNGRTSRVKLNVGNSLQHVEPPHQNQPEVHQQEEARPIIFEYNVEKGIDSNVELSCGLMGDGEQDLKWRKINGVLHLY